MPDVSAFFASQNTELFPIKTRNSWGEEFDGILWVRCHHYLGCLWRKLVCSELGESYNFCRPFTCFFLLHGMNVWQKKLLISIFHTNIHVYVYIYILHNIYFISPNGASVDGYFFSRYVNKPRFTSPLPWGSPSWPRGNGTGAEVDLNSSPLFFF